MERVPELLNWLAEFMGPDWVSKQLQAFRSYERVAVRVLTIEEYHPFVRGLAEGAKMAATASPSQPLLVSPAAIRAASHAYDLKLVGLYMPSVLRSPGLLGRLRSSNGGAESLLFELAVGVHYLLHGCSVEFPELAGLGNTDVLIEWHSQSVEIQCKRKAPGSGRKVPNPLFKRLVALVGDAWSSAPWTYAIILECGDRLLKSHLPVLAEEINSRLVAGCQGPVQIVGGAYSLLVKKQGPRDYRVAAETFVQEIGEFFDDPTRPPHLALLDKLPMEHLEPGALSSPAYLLCRSRQHDSVLDNVMESFREGARQLEGARPGIVTVHMPEPITQDTLDRMAMPTALGDALRREFDDPNRSLSRAAAVVISGENLWPFKEGEWWAGFPGVVFRNEGAAHILPDEYSLLGRLPGMSSRTQ